MPPSLRFDRDGATFSHIAAVEYQKLLALMKDDTRVSKLVTTGNTGTCEMQGVDFLWLYDGTENLHVSITAKHGIFVSRLPNETIYYKLNDGLMKSLA